jgi:hypothetical protein
VEKLERERLLVVLGAGADVGVVDPLITRVGKSWSGFSNTNVPSGSPLRSVNSVPGMRPFGCAI